MIKNKTAVSIKIVLCGNLSSKIHPKEEINEGKLIYVMGVPICSSTCQCGTGIGVGSYVVGLLVEMAGDHPISCADVGGGR